MKVQADWETKLQDIARGFEYPPTPALSRHLSLPLQVKRVVGTRTRLQFAALIVFLLVGLAVFSVPAVRARLAEIFKIGAVQVLPATPRNGTPPPGSTPVPTSEFLVSLDDLAGSTTLANAQEATKFRIRLPSYPVELGAPDRVYRDYDGNMVILVWLDPASQERASISLFQITTGSHVKKYDPPVIAETAVNGNYAIWVTGPYLLELRFNRYDLRRIVEGHTLIWEENGITYRLETSLPLVEAVRVAESLR